MYLSLQKRREEREKIKRNLKVSGRHLRIQFYVKQLLHAPWLLFWRIPAFNWFHTSAASRFAASPGRGIRSHPAPEEWHGHRINTCKAVGVIVTNYNGFPLFHRCFHLSALRGAGGETPCLPTTAHTACSVSLLGGIARAGRLEALNSFIPAEEQPNCTVLRTVSHHPVQTRAPRAADSSGLGFKISSVGRAPTSSMRCYS